MFFVCCGLAAAQDLFVSSEGTSSVKRYDGTTGALLGTFASGGGLSNPNNFVFQTAPVPEPASAIMLAMGLYGALLGTRRRLKK